MRWRKTGAASATMSSMVTWKRPCRTARTFPPSTRFWQGARAGSPIDELLHELGRFGVVGPRVADEIEHEIHDVIRHWHFAHDLLQRENLRAIDDGLNVRLERSGGPRDNLPLLVRGSGNRR
jgi:hypothetical protein